MGNKEFEQNPFFLEAKEGFSNALSQMGEMEADFHPEMMKDYENVRKIMADNLIDLVKFGASHYAEAGDIVVEVESSICHVPVSALTEALGQEMFDKFFGEDIEAEKRALEEKRRAEEEKKNAEKEKKEEGEADANQQMPQVNPWQAFFSAMMMMPFMQAQQNGAAGSIPVFPWQQPQPQPEPEDVNGSELLKDARSLQGRIAALEGNRRKAEAQAQDYKAKFDEVNEKAAALEEQAAKDKENLESLTAAHQQEKEELENKQKELEGKLQEAVSGKEAAEKSAEESAKKIEESEKKAADLQSAVENLKANLAGANNEASAKDTRVKELETKLADVNKQLDRAKSDNSNAQKRLQNASKALEDAKNNKDLEKQIADLQQSVKDANAKYTALKKENDSLSKEAEKLRKENQTLSESSGTAAKELARLKNENASLSRQAFEDQQIGTLNEAAFQRDFPKANKAKAVLAQVSIAGMKMINLNYGMEAGTGAIKRVADEIKKHLPKANVYRVYGDQFWVLTESSKPETVQKALGEAQEALKEVELDVHYGIAAGSRSEKLEDMKADAATALAQQKSGIFTNAYEPDSIRPEKPQELPPEDPEKAKEEAAAAAASPEKPQEVSMDDMLMSYMNN